MTDEQTLWELIAYVDGHNRANGGEEAIDPMSDADFDRLLQQQGS